VLLIDGKVRATGRPRGKAQPAVDVTTYEGGLGTRSREAVDLTVTRNKRRRRSVLYVKQGRTGQITPFKTRKSSPCTNGSRLAVDRFGRISRA
jgi:hypothetical protein